ncbi:MULTISPECIES: hypothetical protein [Amycolatopsis]
MEVLEQMPATGPVSMLMQMPGTDARGEADVGDCADAGAWH